MKVRKKPVEPVEVEAMVWPGYEGTDFDHWLTEADHRIVSIDYAYEDEDFDDPAPLHIRTLEGVMEAEPGDWVIRGVKGELYPCKPAIFAETYEILDEAVS